jgi:hypothetical protein
VTEDTGTATDSTGAQVDSTGTGDADSTRFDDGQAGTNTL